jgi:DHA1 family multidrug resistance protein-like MFS transporter
VLSAVSFTVALGYGIVAPAIPEFAKQFGVSDAAAATVISAFALMRVIGALPAGRLVDRFGEPIVMAAGIAIVAASSILAGFSQSFAELLVLRGVGGLGSAMFSISAQALLLASVPAELRGRASGLYSGGFLLGGISGPALGGLIAAWSLRAPFFIYGGLLAVPAIIAAVALRGVLKGAASGPAGALLPGLRSGERGTSERASREGSISRRPWARSQFGAVYRAAAAANFADGFAALGVRAAIVPLYVHQVLRSSPVWTGIGLGVFAAMNGAMLLPAGRAADKLGRRPVIIAGCVVSGAGLGMLAILPGRPAFLLALAVAGLGSGLLDVAPAAMIGDLISGQGGTLVASYQMAGDTGSVTGPVAAGLLVDSVSFSAAFGLAAGVLGLAAVVSYFAPETRVAREPEAVVL